MGDLAQAIVALARSAERRRGARAELIEATDTIAKAIREQLRAGDAVEAEKYRTDDSKPPEVVEYEAVRARRAMAVPPKAEDVLSRDLALFGLAESQGSYKVDGWKAEWNAHPATAEEREAFVNEVEEVIKKFSKKLTEQALRFEVTAKKAAKLTPR
jgi:hypothetical protein